MVVTIDGTVIINGKFCAMGPDVLKKTLNTSCGAWIVKLGFTSSNYDFYKCLPTLQSFMKYQRLICLDLKLEVSCKTSINDHAECFFFTWKTFEGQQVSKALMGYEVWGRKIKPKKKRCCIALWDRPKNHEIYSRPSFRKKSIEAFKTEKYQPKKGV